MIPTYDKIARAGGIYDTKKYRYIIDTKTGDIKRIRIELLDTTAARDSWETVKKA